MKRLASEKILNTKKIENLRSEIKNKMIDIDALVPTINKERDSYKAKKIEFGGRRLIFLQCLKRHGVEEDIINNALNEISTNS